jgi:amidase
MSVALLPAVEQLRLLRQRKLSALELAEEHIRRIEQINPVLNAFADFDVNRVRAQASNPLGGPLSGLPITIKSSIETAGHRCEIGSRLRRGTIAQDDAEAVRRLRAAGAVILGTTNCPEFLMAYETDNLLHGRTNNPWDLDRTAGGSSGGESAAIAAGLSAAGIGSDSGGSVREPAHFTGICALKPTSGRVPSIGHQPPCVGPFSSLGAVGPMARTIADVELIFQTICGLHTIDPTSAPVRYTPVTLEQAKATPVGWFEDDGLIPVSDETRTAVRAAVALLEQRGFSVKRFRPEGLEEARKLWKIFFVQCGAMFYASTIAGRVDELSPTFRDFLRMAEIEVPLTAASLLQAWADADVLRSRLLAQMAKFPILLLPVCAIPAFPHGEREWSIEGSAIGYLDAMRFTQWFNLLASPAAVVPIGQSKDGLPIGVQIAGRPYEDELVLTVARTIDEGFGYRVPPMAQID